jgi:hypothetical protein
MSDGAIKGTQPGAHAKPAPAAKKTEAVKPGTPLNEFNASQFVAPLDALYVAPRPTPPKTMTNLSFAGNLFEEPVYDENDTPAVKELKNIGKKYNVSIEKAETPESFQKRVVKAVVIAKAKEHGVPARVALGMAGLESEMKMWDNIGDKHPTVVQGKNFVWQRDKKHPEAKAKKHLSSTDWGAMQVNDKAHPEAFPKAKTDLEYNVDYGLRYLADTRKSVKGNLGYGFGDWDRTIGAYNLGHNPRGKNDHKVARRYILAVKGALD